MFPHGRHSYHVTQVSFNKAVNNVQESQALQTRESARDGGIVGISIKISETQLIQALKVCVCETSTDEREGTIKFLDIVW